MALRGLCRRHLRAPGDGGGGVGEADEEFPWKARAIDALFGGCADAVAGGCGTEVGGHVDGEVAPREGRDVELCADSSFVPGGGWRRWAGAVGSASVAEGGARRCVGTSMCKSSTVSVATPRGGEVDGRHGILDMDGGCRGLVAA